MTTTGDLAVGSVNTSSTTNEEEDTVTTTTKYNTADGDVTLKTTVEDATEAEEFSLDSTVEIGGYNIKYKYLIGGFVVLLLLTKK
jgi:hypothetical protein